MNSNNLGKGDKYTCNSNATRKPSRKGNRYKKDYEDKSSTLNSETYSSDKNNLSKVGAGNAFEWYNKYPSQTVGAGSIPYPYKPGMTLPLTNFYNNSNVKGYPIPGLMTLHWCPSLGYSQSQTDPASYLAMQLYDKIRSSFSGTLTVQAPDIVIYLMALDSIFSFLAMLKRMYRCISAYTPENYTLPNALLRGMGLSDDQIANLRMNKTLFWTRTNELILMSRKFRCPAVMDVFNRHHWLNEHVYCDTSSLNSQMFMFVQDSFYQFSMLNTPDGVKAGGLIEVEANWSTFNSFVDDIYELGLSLINALAGSSSAYTISGYLQRAYEGVPPFGVDELLIDEKIEPVADEYLVLHQIANSNGIPKGYADSTVFSATVTQDPGKNLVLCKPSVSIEGVSGLDFSEFPVLVSVRADAPTYIDTIESTRLKHALGPFTMDGTTGVATVYAGTEVVTYYSMVYYDTDGTLKTSSFSSFIAANPMANSTAKTVSLISCWDWHPILYFDAGNSEVSLPFGDLNNVTTMDIDTFRHINRVCVNSEFNVFS